MLERQTIQGFIDNNFVTFNEVVFSDRFFLDWQNNYCLMLLLYIDKLVNSFLLGTEQIRISCY